MIETAYLLQISSKFRNFKRKREGLWNCSCFVCGDSATDKTKARGYFYTKKNKLKYCCHNCGHTARFEDILRSEAPELYREYMLELFKSNSIGRPKEDKRFEDDAKPKPEFTDKLSKLLKCMPTAEHCFITSTNTEFLDYIKSRKIPRSEWKNVFYCSKFGVILNALNMDVPVFKDPRMVMAYRDEEGKPFALFGRSLLPDSKQRYININPNNDNALIFGLDKYNPEASAYLTEGPIDSLFLPNALGASGTAFEKVLSHLSKKPKLTLVTDNQPRNRQVIESYDKAMHMLDRAGLNWSLFLFPPGYEDKAKDVNDLATKLGMNEQQRVEFIKQNSYSGLKAKLKFKSWTSVV